MTKTKLEIRPWQIIFLAIITILFCFLIYIVIKGLLGVNTLEGNSEVSTQQNHIEISTGQTHTEDVTKTASGA